MTIDEKAKDLVAKALYEAMEGPVSNQDFARQQRQWESAQALAVVALEAYESAKQKEVEGWVLVPKDPSDEHLRAMLAVDEPATFRDHLRHPDNGPSMAKTTEIKISQARARYRALLSAAGGR